MDTETEGGRAPWAAVEERQRRRAERDRMWRRYQVAASVLTLFGVAGFVVRGSEAPGWAYVALLGGGAALVLLTVCRRTSVGMDDARFDEVDGRFSRMLRKVGLE